MEIHELNEFSGTLGANDYFATDNTADTTKVSAQAMMAPLNGRIDDVNAALTSTTQEVTDGRRGVNEITYSSIGDAIRGQVGDLDEAIWGKAIAEYGLFDLGSLTSGYCIRQSDGQAISSSAWKVCPLKYLGDAKGVLYTCPQSTNSASLSVVASIAFYSGATTASFISSQPILSGTLGTMKNHVVSVPDNAQYFRVSIYSGKESYYKLVLIPDIIEKFDEKISYSDGDYSELHSRNLIGMLTDLYYPVDIADGESITFSTADGSIFNTDSVVLVRFYDVLKDNTGYVYLNSGLSYKVYQNNTGAPIKYARWITVNPSHDIMVARGNRAKPYVPYYAELKTRFEPIERRVLTTSVISADPIVLTRDIEPDRIYTVKMTISHGRGLYVQAKFGEEWRRVKLVNINTGSESYIEYQHGEYLLLGTMGASQIKCTLEPASTNYGELWLITYGTYPYVHAQTRNTSYLPSYNDISSIALPRCFGIHNGYIYGIEDKRIRRASISTGTIETFFTAPYTISTAMIFDNGNIMYVTADDSENKMYLLSNGTAVAKHDFYDSENEVRLTPNRLFSWYNYKSVGVVSEYYGAKTPISGYKAYITEDYGATWRTIFDLTTVVEDPVASTAHLHSCVYDPYGDMYWACSGDMVTVDGIWYSLDGTNWYKIQTPRISMKPTVIVPMRDSVLFISDSGQVNVYKWQRTILRAGDTLWLDTINMFVNQWTGACPIGSHGYHDPKMNITFFGYDTDDAINEGYSGSLIKHSDVFVTDGFRATRIYASNEETGCLGVYGDDEHLVIAQRSQTIIFNRA